MMPANNPAEHVEVKTLKNKLIARLLKHRTTAEVILVLGGPVRVINGLTMRGLSLGERALKIVSGTSGTLGNILSATYPFHEDEYLLALGPTFLTIAWFTYGGDKIARIVRKSKRNNSSSQLTDKKEKK